MSQSNRIGPGNLVSLVFLAAAAPTSADVIFVDDSAVGANDGSSWCDAFTELQAALAVAQAGDEIRVAAGTYTPDYDPATDRHTGDRDATFELFIGVALRGGYAGCGAGDPDLRDIATYETILSGDLAGNDVHVNDPADLLGEPTRAENSYHVVTSRRVRRLTVDAQADITIVAVGGTINLFAVVTGGTSPFMFQWTQSSGPAGASLANSRQQTAQVTFSADGTFTFSVIVLGSDGNHAIDFVNVTVVRMDSNLAAASVTGATVNTLQNGDAPDGGADNDSDTTALLDGFTITAGNANVFGGGMLNNNASPALTECTFTANAAAVSGGGMYNTDGSNPTLTDCRFRENTAGDRGGGMYNSDDSSPMLAGCTFSRNEAAFSGGGMYSFFSFPTLFGCTFDGNTADRGGGISDVHSSSTLHNCTFIGNTVNTAGGGMNNDGASHPTLTNCTFSENVAGANGGGMCNLGSSPTLSKCVFSGNTAGFNGGGMYNVHSSPTLTACKFSNNTASFNGGGVGNLHSSPSLTNCTFSGNAAFGTIRDGGGGGMSNNTSSPTLTNCTFSRNTGVGGGGVSNQFDSRPTLTNCILWGNIPTQIHTDGSTPELNYCIVEGGWNGAGGVGILDANPLFVDADGADDNSGTDDDDLRLRPGSPCIDAGDNAALPSDAADLDGDGDTNEPLPFDLAGLVRQLDDPDTPNTGNGTSPIVDMGAHEYDSQGDYDEDGSPNDLDNCVIAPNPGQPDTDDDGVGDACDVCPGFDDKGDGDGDGVPDGCDVCPGSDDKADCDGDGVPNACDSDFAGIVILFVDESASAGGDGTSWSAAYNRLELALDAAAKCSEAFVEIWVAAGTYHPVRQIDPGDPRSATFQLVNGVALYGGFAGDETDRIERDLLANPTILSGDLAGDDQPDFTNNRENAYHVVTASGTDATAVLDGFTITAGNADGGYGDDRGGGMYTSAGSPMVSNCIFSENTATSEFGGGGGMYNVDGSPTLNNCTFSRNIAVSGGGMANLDSSPTLNNCTFSENAATGEFGNGGGGMGNSGSSPTLTGCTFIGNTAGVGGGMHNFDSSLTLTNCRFSGNAADFGGGMVNECGRGPTLTNCAFSGNAAAAGGGMCNFSSSPTLTGCTFNANTATGTVVFPGAFGGAMLNVAGSSTVNNCVLWGNTPDEIFNFDPNLGTVAVKFSDIMGGLPVGVIDGGGNIDADPAFIDADGSDNISGTVDDDLRLRAGSPCIDAGDDMVVPLHFGITDLDGNPRFIDGNGEGTCRVDKGAYEFQADRACDTECGNGVLEAGEECDDGLDNSDILPNSCRNDCTFPRCGDGVVDFGEQCDGPNDSACSGQCQSGCNCPLPPVLFVNAGATGTSVGTSWADAYNSLQDALSAAADSEGAVDEIWVAAGVYTPDGGFAAPGGFHVPGSGDRTATFHLLNGVSLFGGFAGGETELTLRDITLHETTLSGDLAGNDAPIANPVDLLNERTRSENSFHVVTGSGTDVTAVLDGFTITAGNASDGCNDHGGGLYNRAGSPTVSNCAFIGNVANASGGAMSNDFSRSNPTVIGCTFIGNAAAFGGGMCNDSSDPTLIGCIFRGNTAGSGGGMCNVQGRPNLTNCTFTGNTADIGGGMYNTGTGSDPTLSNCTITANAAADTGGGMYNWKGSPTSAGSGATLTNCIVWGNTPDQIGESAFHVTVTYSCVQGGWPDTGNTDSAPLFVRRPDDGGDGWGDDPETPSVDEGANDDFGNVRLLTGSPCIDAGDNAAVPTDIFDLDQDGDTAEPLPFDLDGNPRIVNGTVDMGAYEFTSRPPGLISIMRGIQADFGAPMHTFISPLAPDFAFIEFTLEANEPLTLVDAVSTYTGIGTAPRVGELQDNGGGNHTVVMDQVVAPGQWLKLELNITTASGGNGTLTVWVAHQPLDINQDGQTNIRDATAFGDEFRGERRSALIDLNGDGVVNIRDATAFGQIWRGEGGDNQAWQGSALPPIPQ